MRITDFINRTVPAEPWVDGENIPWDDPEFSRRMLKEHLDPGHDAASRRPRLIEHHVSWLHESILNRTPSRVLDLGCGPGMYLVRLAKLGHTVTGIDISPASLEHARSLSTAAEVACELIQGDFRYVAFPKKYELVMQIYGELNVFRRDQARQIVEKCAEALEPGGQLIFEVDRPEAVRHIGESATKWRSYASGLFSDKPHLFLEESFWDVKQRAAPVRYWVVDAVTAEVTMHAQTFAAYEAEEYLQLCSDAGLANAELLDGFPGQPNDDKRWILRAKKAS